MTTTTYAPHPATGPADLTDVDVIMVRGGDYGEVRRYGICQHRASALYYVTMDEWTRHYVAGDRYVRCLYPASNTVRISIRAAMDRYRTDPDKTLEEMIRDFETVLGPHARSTQIR